MKILEINAYYHNGSTGHIVEQLCDYGYQNGYEMYAIYWLNKNENVPSYVYYLGEDSTPGIFTKYSEWVFKGDNLRLHHERTEKIVSCIKNIDPDIIHLHNLHGDFEFGSLDYIYFFSELAKLNKKIVWTLHDCWAVTGRCYHFSYNDCDRWKTECGHCPQRLYDREGVFQDRTSENLQIKKELYDAINDLTIVTVSHWLQGVVKESILKNKKVATIYNGIDTNTFKPVKRMRKGERFTILTIGWDRRKGSNLYYKLSSLLKNDEELLVVGKRPVGRNLKKLPDNIRSIPNVDNKIMSNVYNMADVYYNASVAETFGLTTAEALSCGVPVIGNDSTATPEVIGIDESCGYLIQRNNLGEIRSSIDKIKEKGKKYYSDTCRRRCEELFSDLRMVKEYFDLYIN